MRSTSKARLDEMIDEATADCHDYDEQVGGLFNMIEENLSTPFDTTVLGVAVTVESVDLTDDGQIVASCVRGDARQAISITELPLPAPPPPGVEWIEAYRCWSRWARS